MNKASTLLLVFAFTLTACASTQWRTDCKPPVVSQSTKSGKLRVLSDHPGRIYVDGCSTGLTTPALIDLPVGYHLIGIIFEGWGGCLTHRTKILQGKVVRIKLSGARP